MVEDASGAPISRAPVEDGGEEGPNQSRMSEPPGDTGDDVEDKTRVRDGPQTAPVEEREGSQTEPVEERDSRQTETVEDRGGRQSFVPARGGESNVDSSVSDDGGDEPPTRERDGPQTPPPEETGQQSQEDQQKEPGSQDRNSLATRAAARIFKNEESDVSDSQLEQFFERPRQLSQQARDTVRDRLMQAGESIVEEGRTRAREAVNEARSRVQEAASQQEDGGETRGLIGRGILDPSNIGLELREPAPGFEDIGRGDIMAAPFGVDAPENEEQEEILSQLLTINRLEEGGFTEAEKEAVEAGQERIETRQAQRDIEQAEEQLSTLQQQISSLRSLEEGSSVTLTQDGSPQTVTRDQALSILSEEREQLEQTVESARDELGDPDQRIEDLAQIQEQILEQDPMQGMTTEATLEDASPLEAAAAAGTTPAGFSVAASNVVGGLDTEEETARAIQAARGADGPFERTGQVLTSPIGTIATGAVAGKAFQAGVRGLGAVSQTAGAIGLRGGQAAGVGITALEAQNIAEDVEEGNLRQASIRTGQFVSGSAGFAAGAASGGGLPSFRTSRSVSNIRGGRGEVLLSERSPLQTRTLARTRTAPDEISRALAQDVSSTAPRPSSDVSVGSRLVRSQEFMESQIGRRLSPSEDLPYTQPAPAEVTGTTGTTARGAGQQDFLATVTEGQGPLSRRVFRPTRRTEEVTAVMDQVTATRGAATGTGQVASQRGVPLSDRITLGRREQARLLRTENEGLGFEPAGQTTMQGEPFRFSSRTLLRSVGQESETAPGLVRATSGENPFTLTSQRFVLPGRGSTPQTTRVGAADVFETRGSFDGTPFTGRRTVTRSGEMDAVVSEEPLNLYSRGRQGTSFRGESGSVSRTEEVMGGAAQVTESVEISPELVSNIRGMDTSFIRTVLQQQGTQNGGGLTPVAFTASGQQSRSTGSTTDIDTTGGDGPDVTLDLEQDRTRFRVQTRQDTARTGQGDTGQTSTTGVGTDLSFARQSLETEPVADDLADIGQGRAQARRTGSGQRGRGRTRELSVPQVSLGTRVGQQMTQQARQQAVSRIDTPAPRQRTRTTRATGRFDIDFNTEDIGLGTDTSTRRARTGDSDRLPQLDVLTASIVEGRTGTATAPRQRQVLEEFSSQRRRAGPLAELPALEEVRGETDSSINTGFDLDLDVSFTGGDDLV